MENFTYLNPVAKLLTFEDDTSENENWPNYLAIGLTRENVPELIQLMQDTELAHQHPWNGKVSELAPINGRERAWRALAQLQAFDAIPDILALLRPLESLKADVYMAQEIPQVLGVFGEPALLPSCEYLNDRSLLHPARICAARALVEIGQRHPGTRRVCVKQLIDSLENYQVNDKVVNTFVIYCLSELKAQDAALLVEKIIREGYTSLDIHDRSQGYTGGKGLLQRIASIRIKK